MALFNTNVPELSGSDTAICLDNLELLGLRQSRITETVLAELSELADAIIRDAGEDPDTVDSILLSLLGGSDGEESWPNTIATFAAAVNRELIMRLSLFAEVQLRLVLYRMLADRMPPRPLPRKHTSGVTDAARGRIAYMAGAFADKAYAHLSHYVQNPRAATFHSFVDACEEVRGGLCEYGILPLENTQSGKLTAFSRLILHYGLYVVAVCDLENGIAPGQFTRFALLKKAPDDGSLSLRGQPTEASAGAQYMELLHIPSSLSLSELLNAAVFCGLSPVRIDTLPYFEEIGPLRDTVVMGSVPPMCCVLALGSGDFASFVRFLTLEAPEDILMGLYGIIKIPETERKNS